MQVRKTNDYSSEATEKYNERTKKSTFFNCGKCGRTITDDLGTEIKIKTEQEVRLSPGNIRVLDYTFKVCKKCILRLVGGGGSVLKVKYALSEDE